LAELVTTGLEGGALQVAGNPSRPELEDLQPAESQRDLPMILQKVGERVAMLFEKLPDTTSTEEVRFHSRFFMPQGSSGNTSRRYFRVHYGL
jgi:hypothetical protein